MTRKVQITKGFGFDAAHYLPHVAKDLPNGRMHGHSFEVRVTLTGSPDPETGMVQDFAGIAEHLSKLRDGLDHNLLNEIDGLQQPTLEHISIYIWDYLAPAFPGLTEVLVHRPSCDESCVYRGEGA